MQAASPGAHLPAHLAPCPPEHTRLPPVYSPPLQSELGVEPSDESRAYLTFLLPKAREEALPAFLQQLDARRKEVRPPGLGSRPPGPPWAHARPGVACCRSPAHMKNLGLPDEQGTAMRQGSRSQAASVRQHVWAVLPTGRCNLASGSSPQPSTPLVVPSLPCLPCSWG